eukprot:scaffold4121_cov381-Prasinococcus_capsulatus_cf.AAC.9
MDGRVGGRALVVGDEALARVRARASGVGGSEESARSLSARSLGAAVLGRVPRRGAGGGKGLARDDGGAQRRADRLKSAQRPTLGASLGACRARQLTWQCTELALSTGDGAMSDVRRGRPVRGHRRLCGPAWPLVLAGL